MGLRAIETAHNIAPNSANCTINTRNISNFAAPAGRVITAGRTVSNCASFLAGRMVRVYDESGHATIADGGIVAASAIG